mmetsp:Transcript_38014/g.97153  ORF Transcript_38014/g.97153 Transcript_38014/m.97153 type:complete len:206 (+) Transcript_38014:191-808(+)
MGLPLGKRDWISRFLHCRCRLQRHRAASRGWRNVLARGLPDRHWRRRNQHRHAQHEARPQPGPAVPRGDVGAQALRHSPGVVARDHRPGGGGGSQPRCVRVRPSFRCDSRQGLWCVCLCAHDDGSPEGEAHMEAGPRRSARHRRRRPHALRRPLHGGPHHRGHAGRRLADAPRLCCILRHPRRLPPPPPLAGLVDALRERGHGAT